MIPTPEEKDEALREQLAEDAAALAAEEPARVDVVELAARAFHATAHAHDPRPWAELGRPFKEVYLRRMQKLQEQGLLATDGQYTAFMHVARQLDRLATFMAAQTPAAVDRSDAAVDAAIQLITDQRAALSLLGDAVAQSVELCKAMLAGAAPVDVARILHTLVPMPLLAAAAAPAPSAETTPIYREVVGAE
ncbi:hypothetical protein ORV05_04775 [Amycolatopsis cynarae]|uniref:Uncharacterized protein n=1 Tax=Amycolatopsis cynarae TaxID=2995223 RepID=A0ABY7B467_9PSEU|nr:hypothetical protein [Amycolatopsis sp. HUAS 11-8]WAL67105.1 hypothetical protein ORV05_04775 [Amycolatopsis sp. HUAS 11-8]